MLEIVRYTRAKRRSPGALAIDRRGKGSGPLCLLSAEMIASNLVGPRHKRLSLLAVVTILYVDLAGEGALPCAYVI